MIISVNKIVLFTILKVILKFFSIQKEYSLALLPLSLCSLREGCCGFFLRKEICFFNFGVN